VAVAVELEFAELYPYSLRPRLGRDHVRRSSVFGYQGSMPMPEYTSRMMWALPFSSTSQKSGPTAADHSGSDRALDDLSAEIVQELELHTHTYPWSSREVSSSPAIAMSSR
jgi:hypothetical protein